MIDSIFPTATTGAVAGPSAAPAVPGKALTKDDFLQLLVTQLTHQVRSIRWTRTSSWPRPRSSPSSSSSSISTSRCRPSSGSPAPPTWRARPRSWQDGQGGGQQLRPTGRGRVLALHPRGRHRPRSDPDLRPAGHCRAHDQCDPGQARPAARRVGRPGRQRPHDECGHVLLPRRRHGRRRPGAVASVAAGVLTGLEVNAGVVRYRLGKALIRPEDVIDVALTGPGRHDMSSDRAGVFLSRISVSRRRVRRPSRSDPQYPSIQGETDVEFAVLGGIRTDQLPEVDGRHRQQHRECRNPGVQDLCGRVHGHPEPDAERGRRAQRQPGRHQPHAAGPRCHRRQHHAGVPAGRAPDDQPQYRPRHSGRRLLHGLRWHRPVLHARGGVRPGRQR